MIKAYRMWEASREVVLLLVAARRGCQILFSLQKWVREPFGEAWRRHAVGAHELYIRPCEQQQSR
jgi:hypothetical protein